MTMPDAFLDGRNTGPVPPHETFRLLSGELSPSPPRFRWEDSPVELLEFPDFEDIHYHLLRHPLGMHAIHGYDSSPDWDRLLDCGCEPADPYQKMRWKHTREAFESIKPFLKEREGMLKRYTKQRGYQATLARLRQRDPLYARTMAVMEQLTAELPHVVKDICMPVLAGNFGTFLRLYAELRSVAELLENHGHHEKRRARAGGNGGANTSPRPARHEHVGSTPDRHAREAERQALVARVKAGGAREGDLLRYMEIQDQDRQERG